MIKYHAAGSAAKHRSLFDHSELPSQLDSKFSDKNFEKAAWKHPQICGISNPPWTPGLLD